MLHIRSAYIPVELWQMVLKFKLQPQSVKNSKNVNVSTETRRNFERFDVLVGPTSSSNHRSAKAKTNILASSLTDSDWLSGESAWGWVEG